MKKIIIAGGAALAVLILTVFGYEYHKINSLLPEAAERRTKIGETAELQEGIHITVKERKLFSEEETRQMEEEAYEDILPFPTRIMEVVTEIENVTSKEQKADLTVLCIESLGVSNGVHDTVTEDAENTGKVIQTLAAGETREVKIRFNVLSNQYKKRNWLNVDDHKFYLTYALYPEKKMLELQ